MFVFVLITIYTVYKRAAFREDAPTITTLKKEKLDLRCWINLSGKPIAPVKMGRHGGFLEILVKPEPLSHGATSLRMFPKGTHGFLYLHKPKNVPPIFATLRFRVTGVPSDAESVQSCFAAGHDLLIPSSKLPWEWTLTKLLHLPKMKPVTELLAQDGELPEEVLVEAKRFGLGKKRVLWEFGQPFQLMFTESPFTFDIYGSWISLKGKPTSAIERAKVQLPFAVAKRFKENYPYNGES